MDKRVEVMAALLGAILEEFSDVMGRKAAFGIARRGARKVLAEYRDIVLGKLKDRLPEELLEGL